MFLADTHSDTLFSLGVGKRTFAQTDITPDRLRQGGVSLQTLALWSGPKGPNGDYEAIADAEYAAIHHFTTRASGRSMTRRMSSPAKTPSCSPSRAARYSRRATRW